MRIRPRLKTCGARFQALAGWRTWAPFRPWLPSTDCSPLRWGPGRCRQRRTSPRGRCRSRTSCRWSSQTLAGCSSSVETSRWIRFWLWSAKSINSDHLVVPSCILKSESLTLETFTEKAIFWWVTTSEKQTKAKNVCKYVTGLDFLRTGTVSKMLSQFLQCSRLPFLWCYLIFKTVAYW